MKAPTFLFLATLLVVSGLPLDAGPVGSTLLPSARTADLPAGASNAVKDGSAASFGTPGARMSQTSPVSPAGIDWESKAKEMSQSSTATRSQVAGGEIRPGSNPKSDSLGGSTSPFGSSRSRSSPVSPASESRSDWESQQAKGKTSPTTTASLSDAIDKAMPTVSEAINKARPGAELQSDGRGEGSTTPVGGSRSSPLSPATDSGSTSESRRQMPNPSSSVLSQTAEQKVQPGANLRSDGAGEGVGSRSQITPASASGSIPGSNVGGPQSTTATASPYYKETGIAASSQNVKERLNRLSKLSGKRKRPLRERVERPAEFDNESGTKRSEKVSDDVIQPGYLWNATKMAVVTEERKFTNFFLGVDELSATKVKVQRPYVVTDGARDDFATITNTWPLAELPKFGAEGKPLFFTIQYDCASSTKSVRNITVLMRFLRVGGEKSNSSAVENVRLDFQKVCPPLKLDPGSGKAKTEIVNKGNTIPGLNVGTMRDNTDIMRNGLASPAYALHDDSEETAKVELDGLVLWVTGPGLKLTTPKAIAHDPTVVQTKVSFREGIPLDQNKPRLLGLLLTCLKPGSSMVSVTLASADRAFKRTFFTFEKICKEEAKVEKEVEVEDGVVETVQMAPLKNRTTGVLSADGLDIKIGILSAVKDGLVQGVYQEAQSRPEEILKLRPVVSMNITHVEFIVSYNKEGPPPKLGRPSVRRFPYKVNVPINNPSIGVNMDVFGKLKKGNDVNFFLRFGCYKAGVVNNLVCVKVESEELCMVVRKMCAKGGATGDKSRKAVIKEAEAKENGGLGALEKISGFYVGLSKNTKDVLADGIPAEAFNWDTDEKDLFVVPAGENTLTLFFWRNQTADPQPLRLGAPEISNTMDKTLHQLSGPGSDGIALDADHPTSSMSITFHCIKPGPTEFNIIIPFLPFRDASSRRLLASDDESDDVPVKQSANAKREQGPVNEAKREQGVAKPEQGVAKPEQGVAKPEQGVAGKPQVQSQNVPAAVQEPKVSTTKTVPAPPAVGAGKLKKKKSKKRRFAEAPRHPPTEPARAVPIKISFVKECLPFVDNYAGLKSAEDVGLGGIHMPGLSVCTSPTCEKGTEVVFNGFPLPAYIGQRHAAEPKWHVLDERETATSLYISYKSYSGVTNANKTEDEGEKIYLDSPVLISDSARAKPELTGDGADGGEVLKDGDPMEMELTYGCKSKGLVAVTVQLEVVPHGSITFTFPKMCGGRMDVSKGARIRGLMIATSKNKTDVVQNGVTQEFFRPFRAHESGTNYQAFEDSTTFFIKMVGKRTQELLEPTVFAHRPVANPYIRHRMHVQGHDGDDDEALDMVVIDGKWQKFTVLYNCIFSDSTAITVTFPLPRKGRVSFTWNKVCGQDDDYNYYDGLAEEMGLTEETSGVVGKAGGKAAGSNAIEMSENNGETWQGWDETRWNPNMEEPALFAVGEDTDGEDDDSEDDGGKARSQPESANTRQQEPVKAAPKLISSPGYINVGTTPGAGDVVRQGRALKKYAMPLGKQDKKIYELIKADQDEISFYLSLPAKEGAKQQIGNIEVHSMKGKQGVDIVNPKLTGSVAHGGYISGDAEKLTIQFLCLKSGVTPVMISVPLVPANLGSVSWRVIKVCGTFEKRTHAYMTATNVLLLIVAVALALACCVVRKCVQSSDQSYERVPTDDRKKVSRMGITPDTVQ